MHDASLRRLALRRSPTDPPFHLEILRARAKRVTQLQANLALESTMTPDLEMMGRWAESCTLMKTVERRRERRLALRWPILVSSKSGGRVETRTENLSSGGFYCILENPLAPGEKIDCDLKVPNIGRGHVEGIVGSIRCYAEVLRVEALGTDPGFGVACKILDFTFTKDLRLFKAAARNN